ncbi:FCH domain only protein 2 [Trichinella pseudospiralis]|uniref:FCH domain only protein 2 n=1 Tax=Trichinella pseudospiralis TaxID=6337 RepID=A0A0V1FAS2_TRIPS|nr:FCH domain only protein 2 [Trichinella pseudospiralis]
MEFCDHFWGEKHNGFAVLFHIIKSNHVAVKELTDMIKERANAEDEHQKRVLKSVKQIANYDSDTAFASVWHTIKLYVRRMTELQQGLGSKFGELLRDVQKFGDEQLKLHKLVKEREAKTFEAMNLIQTTTTCLQKAKETYYMRCEELERLKRESASNKDINKCESRMKKARGEYKHYVEKYENVRVDFENRMTMAAKNFQTIQIDHLNQMKQFIVLYSTALANYYQSLTKITEEFSSEMFNLDVSAILTEIIKLKATGTERPEPMKFKELRNTDLLTISSKSAQETASSECGDMLQAGHVNVAKSDRSPSQSSTRRLADLFIPAGYRDRGSGTSSSSSTNSSPLPSIVSAAGSLTTSQLKPKLTMWLPGRRSGTKNIGVPSSRTFDNVSLPSKMSTSDKKDTETSPSQISPLFHGLFNTTSNLKTGDTSLESADLETQPKRTLSMAFLKKKSREKKKSVESSNFSDTKMEEKVNMDFQPDVEIDNTVVQHGPFMDSSSDTDSGGTDTFPRKITVEIKPAKGDRLMTSASVDELREATSVKQTGNVASVHDMEFNMFNDSSNKSKGVKVLRAAKTGDDKWNNLAFAGSEYRLRPRSTTPTHMIALQQPTVKNVVKVYKNNAVSVATPENIAAPANDASDHTEMTMVQSDLTLSSLSGTIPLAMAIIETIHALFKANNECIVKVFGSLTVSFPAGCLALLNKDPGKYPLIFQMKNVEKMHSVVYNQSMLHRLMSEEAQCHSYEFYMPVLLSYLLQQQQRSPHSPYYNVETLRYEVQISSTTGISGVESSSAPLLVSSRWIVAEDKTELSIEYGYNENCPFYAPLINVTFSTDVGDTANNVKLPSDASWLQQSNQLQFRLPEVKRWDKRSGTFEATVASGQGRCIPAPTLVKFQSNGACISNADVQLQNCSYEISLLRKRLISGKYICEPNIQ